MGDGLNRRQFLQGTGGAAATAIAGCLGDDDSNGYETDTPSRDDPVYELDFSATDIDLTQLDTSELDEYDQERILEEELTTTLEYNIIKYEDGDTTGEGELLEPEEQEDVLEKLTLEYQQLSGENHEEDLLNELDNAYTIACNQILDDTRIKAEATFANGQTDTETTTVNKETPESYQLQGIIDGKTITPYETIFLFDNEDRIETTQQKRQEAVESRVSGDERHTEAVENISEQELAEIYEDENLTEEEKKREITSRVSEEARNSYGNFSGEAINQAVTIETIIQEKTPYEQVKFSNVLNPADQTTDESGNHGSIYGVIDNHHMHIETIGPEVTKFGEKNTHMVNGSLSDFVAVHAEFHEGDMDELRDRTKMSRMNGFYTGQAVPGSDPTTDDLTISDEYGSTGLEMLRDHEPREKVMAAVDLAAAHHLETGNQVEIKGTPQEPELHVNKN